MIFSTRSEMRERVTGAAIHIHINRYCSWCGMYLGEKVVEASKEMLDVAAQGNMPVSGGICGRCDKQLREQYENS